MVTVYKEYWTNESLTAVGNYQCLRLYAWEIPRNLYVKYSISGPRTVCLVFGWFVAQMWVGMQTDEFSLLSASFPGQWKSTVPNFIVHSVVLFLSHSATQTKQFGGAVLLQKLTLPQLVQKFTALYERLNFITAFARARHLSLSWARPIQSSFPYPISWSFVLILPSHLRSFKLSLSLRFRHQYLYALRVRAAFFTALMLLVLTTPVLLGDYETPHYPVVGRVA